MSHLSEGRLRRPVCPICNSDSVVVNATARWNVKAQAWELSRVLHQGYRCVTCDPDGCGTGDLVFKWVPTHQ